MDSSKFLKLIIQCLEKGTRYKESEKYYNLILNYLNITYVNEKIRYMFIYIYTNLIHFYNFLVDFYFLLSARFLNFLSIFDINSLKLSQ